MMGSNVKVSLHGGGQAQWSRTIDWVKETGAPNAERHLVKWSFAESSPGRAELIFRILVPDSDLQTMGEPRRLGEILWIDAQPPQDVTVVEVYMAPALPDQLSHSGFPHAFVAALPVEPSRSIVFLAHRDQITATNGALLKAARAEMASIAQASGITLSAGQRGVFFLVSPEGIRGMIEYNPMLSTVS